MNVEQLLNTDMIMFDCIAGSHAYDTNIATSDVDKRGIYLHPDSAYLSLDQPLNQISDKSNDTTYYSLRRFFELTAKATPNTLELLWMPEDSIVYQSDAFKHLVKNRDLFISKKCYHTFTGYALGQCKKSRGQNKWVNNPQPKELPNKLDFCWYIETDAIGGFEQLRIESSIRNNLELNKNSMDMFVGMYGFPLRPRQLYGDDIDILKDCHASKLEHCGNIYRIYDYSDVGGKGVFRGPSQQLVVESIPKEDEWTRFAGLLIFNENAYNAAIRDHNNYWEWIKNRNTDRWVTQEAGEIDYDCYVEEETEFLTNKGWKRFDDINENDILGTINSKHELEFQKPYDKFDNVVNTTFYTYENSYTRFNITGNHKLYLSNCSRGPKNYSTKYDKSKANWKFETVEEYFTGNRSYKHVLLNCENNNNQENNISDDYIKLTAMYLSDGSIAYNRKKEPTYVSISQLENGPYCKIIKSIKDIDYSCSSHRRKNRNENTYLFKNIAGKILSECSSLASTKHLPPWIYNLTTKQFNLFLSILLDGDGYRHPKGHSVYYSNSLRLIEELQILCFMNGLNTQIYDNHISERNKCYQLFISKDNKDAMAINKKLLNKNDKSKSGWTITNGTKRIVCFSVSNSLLVTRNKGKIAIQSNSKNLMHCVRLIKSGRNILEKGEPIVKFTGQDRDFLLEIRKGYFTHDFLMKYCEGQLAEMDSLYKESDVIPDKVNMDKIHNLYLELRNF